MPVAPSAKGTPAVIPVSLPELAALSSLRVYIPQDLRTQVRVGCESLTAAGGVLAGPAPPAAVLAWLAGAASAPAPAVCCGVLHRMAPWLPAGRPHCATHYTRTCPAHPPPSPPCPPPPQEARQRCAKSVAEVERRFPKGLPLLDPVEDMRIEVSEEGAGWLGSCGA